MIHASIRWVCLLSTLFLSLLSVCLAKEEYLPYPGISHIHSSISSGIYPPRKLVSLAQDKGIKILIFADTFLERWEYGLPVFSNIFKISLEEDSVVKYGIKRYLEDLRSIKDEFSDTLILEGTEVAPFYWWSGNLFKKNLSLNDWNRHFLVFGLKSYQDYAYLPVTGNRYFLPQLKDIPSLLIPVALIIWGIFILKKQRQRKFLGWIINIAGILFLFNVFPFSASQYNPYQGKSEFLPHQDLINYVNEKGGLVFWAHPEVTEAISGGKFAKINFYTPSYPEALISTSGYTGFGVNMVPGTSHELVLAGGEWDKVLISYCEGKRSRPAWAIGELDYRGKGRIDAIQNVFFLPELNQKAIYEVVRKGRFYVRYYPTVSLGDFHIEDSQGTTGDFAFMGEEIKIKAKPRLHIKVSCLIDLPEDLRIEIIRDAKIIQEFKLRNEKEFDLEFQDDSLPASDRKSYYRLNFFVGLNIILVTNPIFVEIKNE